MQIQQRHIDALDRAEALMFHCDFCPYLELKELLPDATPQARSQFRTLFTNYYGLNVGGLTDAFKANFFKILFGNNVIIDGRPDFPSILDELSRIRRKKGDLAMPFSFVSKLVAMHQESSPIYDRHVLVFFGEKAPAATVSKANRIAWYTDFLRRVAVAHKTCAEDGRVRPILERLKARDERLTHCDDIRLVDFLVWKVGNQKLL